MNMTSLRRFVSVLALLALAACGGGGGDSGSAPFPAPPGGGGANPPLTAADLALVLSADTISNSGTATVRLTVTALDANRNAMKDVSVSISANNDAVVTLAAGATTDAVGQVVATVGIGANRNNRVITITAVSGTVSKTASLSVVTGVPPVPTASDISLALSAPTIANSGSATVTAVVTAVDANRNAISGIPVTLRVDNESSILVSSATTDTAGVVRGVISIGANKTNRTIKVTATSGSLVKEAGLQVVGTQIAATALPAVLTPGATGRVQYRVIDANNSPLSALPIRVLGPAGVITDAITDSNGAFEYVFVAPAAATGTTTLEVRATAGGVERTVSILVQSGPGTIPNVPANSVLSASVRANPSVVPVNSGTLTSSRSEVRALFVGTANKPISNVRVRFDLNNDANSIGGSFTSGNTLIYSDANGIAATTYVPGSRFSPTDGLTIRACWDYADFAAGTCPNSALTTVTVISEPLSVSVGTDNLILISEPLVYVQRFVVQVNDSSGLAKADVKISPLLDLTSYSQGSWVRPPGADRWSQNVTTADCGNEDVNRNGVLEVYSNTDREDANGNGQLEPRKADAVVSYEGADTTGPTGRIILRVAYPRNVGSWVRYALTVAANGVSGTEGRASFSGLLAVPIDDVKADGEPAFRLSPYGTDFNASRVVVTVPNVTPVARATLCTR